MQIPVSSLFLNQYCLNKYVKFIYRYTNCLQIKMPINILLKCLCQLVHALSSGSVFLLRDELHNSQKNLYHFRLFPNILWSEISHSDSNGKPKNTSTPDESHPDDLVAENSVQKQLMKLYLPASLTVTAGLLSLMVITAYILKRRKFHTPCLQWRDDVSLVKAVPETEQCKKISINTEIIDRSCNRLGISSSVCQDSNVYWKKPNPFQSACIKYRALIVCNLGQL